MRSTKKTKLPDLAFAEDAKGSFGTVEISDEDVQPENVRVRISIMIPSDVLAKLRGLGRKYNKGYQTVANDLLREAVSVEGEIGERWKRIKLEEENARKIDELMRTASHIQERIETLVEKDKPTRKRAKK